MKKVGVTKEEQALPYFKYYEQELAPIPAAKLDVLIGGANRGNPPLPFSERNLYLQGKDEDFCQVGFGVADDGTGYVCNETYMPGVTPEMLYWWFAWHPVGSDLRYKIWDNEDHYFAKADNVSYVIDPQVPISEKTWGINHYVMEDIGFGPGLLILHFKRPKDYGYDESAIGTESCSGLVCAVGEGDCPAAMTHKWYTYKDGVMLCSRFWVGYKEENGKIVRGIPDGQKIPVIVTEKLFSHNIKEFSNLAAILPALYAEQKDNF